MVKTKDEDIKLKLAQANVSIQNLIEYLVEFSVNDCLYGECNYCPWSNDNIFSFAIDEKTEPKNCQHINCDDCKQNLYPPVLRKGLRKKYIIQ